MGQLLPGRMESPHLIVTKIPPGDRGFGTSISVWSPIEFYIISVRLLSWGWECKLRDSVFSLSSLFCALSLRVPRSRAIWLCRKLLAQQRQNIAAAGGNK